MPSDAERYMMRGEDLFAGPDADSSGNAAPYLQQIARAYRFLDRYAERRVYAPGPTNLDAETFNLLEDSMWAFFQNCWHIKDWINNDPSVSRKVSRVVVGRAERTTNIVIAGELARGSKHFAWNSRHNQMDAREAIIEMTRDPSGAILVEHVIETSDGTRRTAYVIAHEAMRDWHTILCEEGLRDLSEMPC